MILICDGLRKRMKPRIPEYRFTLPLCGLPNVADINTVTFKSETAPYCSAIWSEISLPSSWFVAMAGFTRGAAAVTAGRLCTQAIGYNNKSNTKSNSNAIRR